MAGGLLSAELAATCNAIGFFDGNKYHLEPHSKETIRDLIRYLRRDETTHDIRRFLGNTKILNTDLLPILQCHAKEKDLFDLVLRLTVNLSTPALIVYNEVVPTDKGELNQYMQIVSHLQSYKEAFADHKSWASLTEQLSILLNKDIEGRDDDDQRTIERILILIRNILHIPSDALAEGRPDNDASVHDQVVWALHQSSMLDLLLYMASSSQESSFFMHLLEIICLMVREQPPSLLAQTAAQRSAEEKNRDEEELLKLRQKEQQVRQNKTRQYLGSRHSNFGGTFVIKNMKSTTDNDLIYHKPLHKVNHFSLDVEKKKVKIPKNRLPLKCGNVERRSALSVRLILKQFCVEILNAAYNPLMRYIKDCLSRGKTQDNDESYYFTAMKFFMEFNRMYKFQVKLVSETMSVETFHFVQKFLETWHEMMITDKKKINLWSARMHLALKAYKELLLNLAAMDASTDSSVRESSKVIKSNVFYVVEYREMLLTLINTFKKSKYSHQYLVDLIETTHIFMKLLSKFCQRKKIIVQKHIKQRKKTKSKKRSESKQNDAPIGADELWQQICPSVEKVLTSPITKEVIPFDATSGKSIDEQKIDAVKRIQMLLKSGEVEESVALLRASREVWPENDSFGKCDISQEEEVDCLREVFFADLGVIGPSEADKENHIDGEAENENNEGSDDEEEESYPSVSEQTVDFLDLVKRFASPRVMGVCVTLLSTYEANSAFTNHCVAKMLHRIAWDCKLPSMLFQASLFMKFKTILESRDPAFKELAALAIYVIRKFTEVASTNKKVFMELLFYKNAKDAYEIECGYGSFQKTNVSKQVWEDHEEDELRRLHKEYSEVNPSEDMITWISDNLINEKSRRNIVKKMKELGLNIAKTNQKGNIISWTNEQEEELKELYDEFKDHDSADILDMIIQKLSQPRTRRNIATALVRLGCAESTKQFRKKKKSGGKTNKSKGESSNESESSEEDEDPSEMSETREQIRAKEVLPDLYQATENIFSEKGRHPYLVEGLRWLNTSISECLEDLDDDPAEVPLLPLSNESILSIENNEFKCLLSALGVFKPLDQEIYWRFPAEWKENEFKMRMNFLDLIINYEAMEDCLTDINTLIKEITGKDPNVSSSDDEAENDGDSSVPTTPVLSKTSKSKQSPKSKLQQLKNKLLNNKDAPSKQSKPKSKPNKRKKNENKWQFENMDEVSSEDFNEMVNEQCREILREDNKDRSKDYQTQPQTSPNKNASDSDNEESTKVKSIPRRKSLKLLKSDSEIDDEGCEIIPENLEEEDNMQLPDLSVNINEESKNVHNLSIKKSRKLIDSESDIEDRHSESSILTKPRTSPLKNNDDSGTVVSQDENMPKRRTRVLGMLVDSDSETDEAVNNSKNSAESRVQEESVDENIVSIAPATKRSRIMSSDSEDEIEKKSAKKKHVILSDDDDD